MAIKLTRNFIPATELSQYHETLKGKIKHFESENSDVMEVMLDKLFENLTLLQKNDEKQYKSTLESLSVFSEQFVFENLNMFINITKLANKEQHNMFLLLANIEKDLSSIINALTDDIISKYNKNINEITEYVRGIGVTDNSLAVNVLDRINEEYPNISENALLANYISNIESRSNKMIREQLAEKLKKIVKKDEVNYMSHQTSIILKRVRKKNLDN